MMELIRPGSPDANGEIWAQAREASPFMLDVERCWRGRITFEDFDDADTSEDLDVGTLFLAKGFPPLEGIHAGEFFVDLVQTFGGGTVDAATIILGQASGGNSFLTSINVFTGQTTGWKQTPAASLFGKRLYSVAAASGVLAMFMRLATNAGNIDTLTSGIVDIYMPFRLAPAHRAA